MKIRNLSYNQLNETEKAIVKMHYKELINDDSLECNKSECANSIEEFWERHREQDTDNGNYDKWKIPKCPRCQGILKISNIDGYDFECSNCDEDFYYFEIGANLGR